MYPDVSSGLYTTDPFGEFTNLFYNHLFVYPDVSEGVQTTDPFGEFTNFLYNHLFVHPGISSVVYTTDPFGEFIKLLYNHLFVHSSPPAPPTIYIVPVLDKRGGPPSPLGGTQGLQIR